MRILEAKIRGKVAYTSRFLLGTDFGNGASPTTELSKARLEDLSSALFYQLNERNSFVKPPDPIVAQLLFELGNVELLLKQHETALGDYRLAMAYGFSGPLIDLRVARAGRRAATGTIPPAIITRQHLSRFARRYGVWIAALAIVLPISYFYRRRRKRPRP